MKRLMKAALMLLLGVGMFTPAHDAAAQLGDDLYLYGFFQSQYRYSSETGTSSPDDISSFGVQQLNTFLAKQFSPSFSSFVNLEFTNNFSTKNGWGSLRLEEAWMRYNASSKLNVKAGLLTPEFNNLNTVKNRTPLLPYAFRPIGYETSFSSVLRLEALVPEQAYVQVYGALPVGKVRFDYAAYVGNSESSYAAPRTIGTVTAGMDTTKAKMVGGRLGVRWRSVKAGVSGTIDQARLDALDLGDTEIPIGLGDTDRTRLGFDLSFYKGSLFFESEAIMVKHKLDDVQQATLAALNGGIPHPAAQGQWILPPGVVQQDMDMSFYYGLMGYNVTEKLYAYGMYNFFKDSSNGATAAGIDVYSGGVGFRPVDGVTLKAQYARAQSRDNLFVDLQNDSVFLAASVFF